MSGYSLTYIDVDPDVISMLDNERAFGVVSSEGSREIAIDGAILAGDEAAVTAAIANADVVATAVGGPVLQIVAPAIGAGLAAGAGDGVNVLACENTHPNSTALRAHVAQAVGEDAIAGVGFPDVVVDRIVPGAPGMRNVEVEAGFEFVVDATGWIGLQPDPTPVVFTENLGAYKLRKLWLVNGLHAITAWLALAAGHEYIHEAMRNAEIRRAVESAGRAAADALVDMTDEFDQATLDAYLARSLARFTDDSLPDVAVRVARNPLAKLGQGERVVGPALAAQERSYELDGFAAGIAAALTLDDSRVAGVAELREAIDRSGWQAFAADCGVEAGSPLQLEIEEQMKLIEQKWGSEMITEEVTIKNPAGLHARPAAEIVERSKTIDAQIHIHKGEKKANAKSIMSVLALGANTGDTVTIVAEGPDAADAVEALRGVMEVEEH
jgi:mannitol-1-phosphate 5-dehydrogenase